MGSFADLLTDPRVYAYFAALLWSAYQCFRRSAAWGRALAALCVGVTWYFIVPYIVDYAGDELFDDAYADVVRGGAWFWSSQLLTWVVVGMVWMHEASIVYPVLGMLGAMSASFLTWLAAEAGTSSASPPSSTAASKRRFVSAWYAPMSSLSLVCIYQLPRALGSAWFSFWLRGLHVALILPAMVARPYGLKISGAWLHAALGVAIAAFHLAFFRREIGLLVAADTSAMSWPVTNCQISITIDLLVCALLTFAAVHWHYSSVVISVAAAVATIVVSPGAVLALHLALRGDGRGMSSSVSLRARLVTWLQHTAAKRERAIHRNRSATSSDNDRGCDGGHAFDWMNLGLGGWRGDSGSATGASAGSYDDACARLSLTLGAAVMRRGDGVLAVGCGFGAELVQWKRAFDLLHITGVDPNEAAAAQFRPRQHNVRLLCASAADVRVKFGAYGNGGACFDRIVALDSIYHFADKAAFLADAAAIAPRTGTLGVTDLIVLSSSGTIPIWLRALLWCMNVNSPQLWSEGEYRQHLARAGWANATIQMLGSSGIDCSSGSAAACGVLNAWMPAFVRRHLGYALIVATKCASIAPGAAADPRPTVAIVGSGISGLTCAQLLKHSHDVTVFEASDKCGLSGHGMDVAGQCVDAPLRIIGQGYYRFMEKLVRSVDVTLQPIREDFFSQCHYGKSDSDEPKVTLTASVWSNLVALLPHARDLSRMRRNLYDGSHTGSATVNHLDCLDGHCDETQTFGEWCAERRYRLWPHAGDSSGIGTSASVDGEQDDIVLWLLMGQASWMLSCSYEQVLGYPARTILDFYRGLRLGTSTCDFLCSSPQSGRMLRVMPSMAALEHELIYGCRTEFGARVGGIDSKRVVGGRTFDRVVIATEAAAVPKVLSPSVQCTGGGGSDGIGGTGKQSGGESVASVFARVQYQPSTLFVHADPTLMPPRRADWCAVNVHQPSADRASMCQLTIWLNAFYPEHSFPHDVFETWNPFHRPSHIIKELHFLRVVHTRETPALLRRIDAMQGTAGGVYFAGAYAVDGMGLLEQGALSAKKVADLIHAELAAAALTAVPGQGSSAPSRHAVEPVASKRKSARRLSNQFAARTPRAARMSSK